jgi:two-component system cell cycle response regulator
MINGIELDFMAGSLLHKRKTDSSSGMLMFNTITLGVAAGLVALAWIIQVNSPGNNPFAQPGLWSRSDQLLAATVALLLGGFFHSIMIVYPDYIQREKERILADEKANRLENIAMSDALTGIHNRRYFDAALTAYLEEFSKTGASFGLFLIDIDHFKSVNDTHGHMIGDGVLREIAQAIANSARDHDVVARIGGEEFAVIAPYAQKADLVSIGERYRKSVEAKNIRIDDVVINPTISIGIESNANMATSRDIFRSADKKLYEAKQAGRNRVVV